MPTAWPAPRLTVDGASVSQVNGPYTAASGVNFSGEFGTLAAGNHSYVITAMDKLGNSSTLSGKFTVAASGSGSASAQSLARSAVMQSAAAGATSSAKVDWLFDVPSLAGADKSTSSDAVDAVLASYL